MFDNYFKIAWRNFRKNKIYSLINMIGLSIGISSVILIMLFVNHELSFDKFHEDYEDIYIVTRTASYGGEQKETLSNFFPLSEQLSNDFPYIQEAVTTTYPGAGGVSSDGKLFFEEDKLIASTPGFFEMFNFPLVSGDSRQVLSSPGEVVLNYELARKLFVGENPIGKTIIIDRLGKNEYKVVGIAKSTDNSYLSFDAIFSISSLKSTQSNQDSWNSSMYNSFVRLVPGSNPDYFKKELDGINKKYVAKSNTGFSILPISDLYMSDLVEGEIFAGDYFYIYLFSTVAILIILLATINFLNLSTIQAIQRNIEVGIRKVFGAKKHQLMTRFLGESFIVTTLSVLVSFILVEFFLPYFNHFFSKNLSLNLFESPVILSILVTLIIIVGLLSGIYPSLFLSKIKTTDALKNHVNQNKGILIRKSLVISQFFITSILIICTIVVLSQLSFIQERNLGFDKEEIVYIPIVPSELNSVDSFKQSLNTYSGIKGVSLATGIPGRFWFSKTAAYNSFEPDREFNAYHISTDENFDEVMGLKILAGSYFSEQGHVFDSPIIINEKMVEEMGWGAPLNAIGKEIKDAGIVAGVINDFNFQSLKEDVDPVIISSVHTENSPFGGGELIAIRFEMTKIKELQSFIDNEWQRQGLTSSAPLHYLDEELQKYYTVENKLASVFIFFAAISILIACLGLFGLSSFSIRLRVKEVGIRKVLGASIPDIVLLFIKDLLRLVIIGFILSIPLAWYAMNKWLSEFAFKISITPNMFVIAGLVSIIIAFVSIGWQSVKAGSSNPIDSIRNS